MTSISSIDTSLYTGLLENNKYSSGQNAPQVAKELSLDSSQIENNEVDLKNYYSNIRPEDVYANMGDNVVKSVEQLDNAMVSAIQNGFGVNDAINVKMAEIAYKANLKVYQSAIELTI